MKCEKCGRDGLEYNNSIKTLLEPCEKKESIKAFKDQGFIKMDNKRVWKKHVCRTDITKIKLKTKGE